MNYMNLVQDISPKLPLEFRQSQVIPNPNVSVGIYSYDSYHCLHFGKDSNIYFGASPLSKNDLAFKVSSFKNTSEETFKRSENEIKLLKNLNHQNIVKFTYAATSPTQTILITKFCNQGDLRSYVQNLNFKNINDVSLMFYKIINAVKFLNEKKICHMNLTPKNILIHNSKPKLCDFGSANNIACLELTNFSSPQVLKEGKKRLYDIKDEIWSLGLILYFMIYRKLPWDDSLQTQNILQMIEKCKESRSKIVDFQQKARFEVSNEVKELLTKMVEIEEKSRIEWSDLLKHPLMEWSALQIKSSNKKKKSKNFVTRNVKSIEELAFDFSPSLTQSQSLNSCILFDACIERSTINCDTRILSTKFLMNKN